MGTPAWTNLDIDIGSNYMSRCVRLKVFDRIYHRIVKMNLAIQKVLGLDFMASCILEINTLARVNIVETVNIKM